MVDVKKKNDTDHQVIGIIQGLIICLEIIELVSRCQKEIRSFQRIENLHG